MFEILIQLDPTTGQINVTGPLEQDVMCFGLLEKAKEVVREHCEKVRRASTIVPASNGIHNRFG